MPCRRGYLEGFVEEEAEVGEDDPQLLPAVAVLELAQQVAAQLVLQKQNHQIKPPVIEPRIIGSRSEPPFSIPIPA